MAEGETMRVAPDSTLSACTQQWGHTYSPLKRKTSTISVRLDFLKCVHIFILFKMQMSSESLSRFSRHCTVQTCVTDEKMQTRFQYLQIWVLKKMKIGQTWENLDVLGKNLDAQKLLGFSVSGILLLKRIKEYSVAIFQGSGGMFPPVTPSSSSTASTPSRWVSWDERLTAYKVFLYFEVKFISGELLLFSCI